MATETHVVNVIVADIKAHPDKYKGFSSRGLRHRIARELAKDDPPGQWHPQSYHNREDLIGKLEHKIHKKLGQPFRRKKRGPLRKRASGKNEVTRRRK